MATVLPKPEFTFFRSLLLPRSLLPPPFSGLTLPINGERPVRASSISFRRQRERGVDSASRWRCWTASTSSAFVLHNEKEHGDEEEEEEGEENFDPLGEMSRWLQNKPAGFGEGKTYDTAVEDKILEELDLSRKNQLEEKRKPRASAKDNAGSVKKQTKQTVTDAIKSDTEVRVGNLPKKKNIDRDLWKAFKEFPGITNISPAVTGNRKTRDPICRGFAIVGFKSEDAANRFVQKYSKQILLFGKVQKQIFCDIYKSSDMAEHGNEMSILSTFEISESDNGTQTAEENREDHTVLLPNERTSFSANKTTEIAMAYAKDQKKTATKNTKATPSKSRALGSLARLKIKERAVLTGVFSKYGVDPSPTKEV